MRRFVIATNLIKKSLLNNRIGLNKFRNFTSGGNNPDPKSGQKVEDEKKQDEKRKEEVKSEEVKGEKPSEGKGVKHIFKQKPEKEPEQDIIYDEAHAYREGYDEGYYVREKMSYVYYEVPGSTSGRTSESGGKSTKQEETTKDEQKESTPNKPTQDKSKDTKKEADISNENKKI